MSFVIDATESGFGKSEASKSVVIIVDHFAENRSGWCVDSSGLKIFTPVVVIVYIRRCAITEGERYSSLICVFISVDFTGIDVLVVIQTFI